MLCGPYYILTEPCESVIVMRRHTRQQTLWECILAHNLFNNICFETIFERNPKIVSLEQDIFTCEL